ncbi:YqiA/YcfP family alpha/beta fold hydrolase [Teredinibacter franksiae]|jgi:Predicted esterase|uniref:YqiA/YcfP family alpha/beta fold hydrolase n=1 Tax=Teredinibacter franksiae TaxID=2761453 RepID=UPI0016253D9E|nr:YqiA/YcfP family alpha/beta fold hydrolase [Teredinibacter franksiae]
MATILYIHGFLSSPQSFKARVTQQWLAANRPDLHYICPALSSYPQKAAAALKDQLKSLAQEPLYIIGSSLGGFWATWLIEQSLAKKAVIINPAVAPQTFVRPLLGEPLKSYYTDEVFTLGTDDLAAIEQYDYPVVKRYDAYWLMVQMGDETLPYQQAVAKYRWCQQRVEPGGSHTFDGYEKWLPKIMNFFNV